MKRVLVIIVFFLSVYNISAQEKFNSLNELLSYASVKSITLQSNGVELNKAKKAKLAAILGIIDPVGNGSASFINNTKLPVSLFPAELFGGEPGTFTEVQTGIQYNTTVNQNVDVKLINLKGWQNLRLAKVNIKLTEADNMISLKSLQENIAINYFNILTLKEQLKATNINIQVSDSLYQVANNKYNQGQVRQQDVNNAKVNLLKTQESANQIVYLIKQYYTSLKNLCDIPDEDPIEIIEEVDDIGPQIEKNVQFNMLQVESAQLNEMFALGNYKQYKSELFPTLSFVFSNTFQQFNENYTVFGGDWITSSYVGLKLSMPIPNATTISNKTKAKFDYQLAQNATEQAKIKADLDQRQLENDYEKAVSQYSSNQEIYKLNFDTYHKNKNLYIMGLIGMDDTLDSYNEMVDAKYEEIASKINVLLAEAKIDINNNIQIK